MRLQLVVLTEKSHSANGWLTQGGVANWMHRVLRLMRSGQELRCLRQNHDGPWLVKPIWHCRTKLHCASFCHEPGDAYVKKIWTPRSVDGFAMVRDTGLQRD